MDFGSLFSQLFQDREYIFKFMHTNIFMRAGKLFQGFSRVFKGHKIVQSEFKGFQGIFSRGNIFQGFSRAVATLNN